MNTDDGARYGHLDGNAAVDVLEARLRSDLPALADALLDQHSAAHGEVVRRSHSWTMAVAAAILIALVGGSVLALKPSGRPNDVVVADGDLGPGLSGTDGQEQRRVDGGETALDADPPVGFGTWKALPSSPIPSRSYAAAYWDGDEAVFWAGSNLSRNVAFSDGAGYNPSTRTWRTLKGPGWGHPGLSAVGLDEAMVAVAKGGAVIVDPTTGEASDIPRPDGGEDTAYAGAAVGDGVVYLLGTRFSSTAHQGVSVIGHDPKSGRTWTVWDDPDANLGPVDYLNSSVQLLWTGTDLIAWSAPGTGFRIDPTTGKADRLPSAQTRAGAVGETRLVMTETGPVVVARVDVAGASAVQLGLLVADYWKWFPSTVAVDDFSTATLVGAGPWVVMVSADESPLAWHVPSGQWLRDESGPRRAGTNLVWTGEQIIAWGGTVDGGSSEGVAMAWSPPEPTAGPSEDDDRRGRAGAIGPAIFDIGFDNGDRFRLALPARLYNERFEVVQEPSQAGPAVLASRSLRITIAYRHCPQTDGRANSLGAVVTRDGDETVVCRPNDVVTATVEQLTQSGTGDRSALPLEVSELDVRPVALGTAYRAALADTWNDLNDCDDCVPPFGPYLGDGGAVVNVNGPTTVEALHPVTLDSLWMMDPGGGGTTLHALPDGVGLSLDGGDFISVDSWLGTVQWRILRDPGESSTVITNHGDARSGFGLMQTEFSNEGSSQPARLRRFDRSTGRIAWSESLDPAYHWLPRGLVVAGEVIVIATDHQAPVEAADGADAGIGRAPGEQIIGIDADTGARIWSRDLDPLPGGLYKMSLDSSGAVLISTNSATTIQLDPATGDILAS